MIHSLSSADPARTLPAPASSSFCACLCERVEAVWNAFLALVESILSWCGEKIHGIGSPSELPAFPNSHEKVFEAQRKEQFKEKFTPLVEWFNTFDDQDFDRGFMPMQGAFFRTWISHELPLDQKVEKIREIIKQFHLLHMVANPHFTKKEPIGENATEMLLKLGADPNKGNMIGRYTPLHCAVYSGCFLAYRTLREYGADPLLPMQNLWKMTKVSPIALAQEILKQKAPNTYFPWIFNNLIDERDRELCALFPHAMSKRPALALEGMAAIDDQLKHPGSGKRSDFGSFEEIEQMLAYEEELVAPIKQKLDTILGLTLPPPLLAMIVDHLKYQVLTRNP